MSTNTEYTNFSNKLNEVDLNTVKKKNLIGKENEVKITLKDYVDYNNSIWKLGTKVKLGLRTGIWLSSQKFQSYVNNLDANIRQEIEDSADNIIKSTSNDQKLMSLAQKVKELLPKTPTLKSNIQTTGSNPMPQIESQPPQVLSQTSALPIFNQQPINFPEGNINKIQIQSSEQMAVSNVPQNLSSLKKIGQYKKEFENITLSDLLTKNEYIKYQNRFSGYLFSHNKDKPVEQQLILAYFKKPENETELKKYTAFCGYHMDKFIRYMASQDIKAEEHKLKATAVKEETPHSD